MIYSMTTKVPGMEDAVDTDYTDAIEDVMQDVGETLEHLPPGGSIVIESREGMID
jgi:hypothetical protein